MNEKNALATPGTSAYRPDLALETNGFGAVGPAAADPKAIAVYRFFDTTKGTHFYTSNATEFAAITTKGGAAYQPNLVSEGVAFYAPAAA